MRRVNIYHWYKGALTRRGFSQVPSDPASRVQQSYTKIRDVAFEKVSSIKGVVDDIVGITEVQKAQISVREAENEFMNTRKKVGELKKDLDSLHTQLAKLRSRLDRTPRHDEKYLALATDEHNILREEKRLKSVYDQAESLERDQFVQLSASVRDSHERERARAERTKYWSVMGSLGGAFLGKHVQPNLRNGLFIRCKIPFISCGPHVYTHCSYVRVNSDHEHPPPRANPGHLFHDESWGPGI